MQQRESCSETDETKEILLLKLKDAQATVRRLEQELKEWKQSDAMRDT